MSKKAHIIEQLANVKMRTYTLPWGEGEMIFRYAKTLNEFAFGCGFDLATAMSAVKDKTTISKAMSNTLKKCGITYRNDLHAAIEKVSKPFRAIQSLSEPPTQSHSEPFRTTHAEPFRAFQNHSEPPTQSHSEQFRAIQNHPHRAVQSLSEPPT